MFVSASRAKRRFWIRGFATCSLVSLFNTHRIARSGILGSTLFYEATDLRALVQNQLSTNKGAIT
jgi:hypothetical protein